MIISRIKNVSYQFTKFQQKFLTKNIQSFEKLFWQISWFEKKIHEINFHGNAITIWVYQEILHWKGGACTFLLFVVNTFHGWCYGIVPFTYTIHFPMISYFTYYFHYSWELKLNKFKDKECHVIAKECIRSIT